jgi:hypothetical protein
MAQDRTSPTSVTLLGRLRRVPADPAAWSDFVARSGPRILPWCRRWHLQEADAQDALLKLHRLMATFSYDASGSFRGWLQTLASWSTHGSGRTAPSSRRPSRCRTTRPSWPGSGRGAWGRSWSSSTRTPGPRVGTAMPGWCRSGRSTWPRSDAGPSGGTGQSPRGPTDRPGKPSPRLRRPRWHARGYDEGGPGRAAHRQDQLVGSFDVRGRSTRRCRRTDARKTVL